MNIVKAFEGYDLSLWIDENNLVYFRSTHLCKILAFKNPAVAVKNNCKKEIKTLQIGGGRAAQYISESDMYRLIFASKAPIAEKFQDWICDELLPSIRKEETYMSLEITLTKSQAIAMKEKIDRILNAPDFCL
jgi:anti-repressor protein